MDVAGDKLDVVAQEQLANLAIMKANAANVESATAVNVAQAENMRAGADYLRAKTLFWKRLACSVGWLTAVVVWTAIVVLVVVGL
jgi:hypothetical protein